MKANRVVVPVLLGSSMFAAGFGIGASLFLLTPPPTLVESEPVSEVPVVARPFDDARVVAVEVDLPNPVTLVLQTGGRVTAVSGAPGEQLRSGSSVLSVDGSVVVALATETPQWRDLAIGDSGPDVVALQHELERLGYASDGTGSVGPYTLEAVRELLGRDDEVEVIRSSFWLWLPASSVTVAQWQVQVGAMVADGEAVVEVEVEEASARVTVPEDAVAGERELVVDGRAYEIGTDSVLAAERVADLLSGPTFETARQQATGSDSVTVSGSWRLSEPITVHAIPPVMLLGDQTGRCVIVSGSIVAVRLVSSELGMSLVVSEEPIDRVQMPSGDEDCS